MPSLFRRPDPGGTRPAVPRDLWWEAEYALEAVTPALWQMALAAQALLDTSPPATRPNPGRALRKPQVEGEVAVVLRIEPIAIGAASRSLGDLQCRIGRQWSFSPRWPRRTRAPVWRDLAIYDLRDLRFPTVHVVEDMRIVVAGGLRTRARDADRLK